MKSTVFGGAVLLVGVVGLASCNDGAPTSPAQAPVEPVSLAVAANACKPPKDHPAGKIIGTTPAVGPWAVAVRDDGLAYFTAVPNNSVGITNTTTRTITGYIPTGSIPTGIAFSPDGTRAYTANQGDNSLGVIDVASSQQVASVAIGGSSPFSVEVSPDGGTVYVGNNDNTLTIVDAQTLQIIKTVIVGFATNAFAVDPAGRMLYASHFVSATVSEIDMVTNTVMRTFSLGGTPQGMALNKKGTHLFVANQGGYMSDIDLRTGQQGAQIPIGGVGFGVGVSADDNEAWITLPLDGKVQIFNLKKRKVVGTLVVGGEPRRVAFSDQGKIGAVTNQAGYITFVK